MALVAVCVLVPLAVLAPLLVRGFVLSYDMVFVPRQHVGPDAVGLGTALPRSVPADAVVALATGVLPGDLLQQLVLAATLALAGLGAALVLPADRPLGRCVAAVGYAWNPYVAERLVQGHWALLVGYAALPWVLRAAADVRRGVPGAWPRLALGTAAAALTPAGGLLAAALAGAVLAWPERDRVRRGWLLRYLTLALVLNAPWVVPGLPHPARGSDPAGVDAFAARAENWSGTLGSLLGLGGIWNGEVVPASRTLAVAPLLSGLLLALAGLGGPALHRRLGGPVIAALASVAAVGLLLAAAPAVPPGRAVLRALVEHVTGAGLVRDGQKLLAPLALLLAVAAGLGAERLTARLRTRPALATAAAGLLLALPVVTTPDLGWGAGGRLAAVRYPSDWAAVRDLLARSDEPGDVAVLPFGAFRSFGWNGGRTVLDPAPRAFDRTVVADDTLVVGGQVVGGEDPRARAVRDALRAGEPLGPLGIGWVVVERDTPGPVPAAALSGAELRHTGPDLELYRLPGHVPVDWPAPPEAPVLLADALATATVVAAAGAALAGGLRRRRRSGSPSSRPIRTGW